jgi:hypothetical protein
MKRILLILLLCASTARAVITYTDELNPGPAGTGIVINPNSPPHFYSVENWQSSLNGTGFNGQTVRLDLLFNGFFVRAYTQTEKLHSFLVDLFLPYLPFWDGVNPPPDSPSVSGTATLLNAVGQPIGSPNVLNAALSLLGLVMYRRPSLRKQS